MNRHLFTFGGTSLHSEHRRIFFGLNTGADHPAATPEHEDSDLEPRRKASEYRDASAKLQRQVESAGGYGVVQPMQGIHLAAPIDVAPRVVLPLAEPEVPGAVVPRIAEPLPGPVPEPPRPIPNDIRQAPPVPPPAAPVPDARPLQPDTYHSPVIPPAVIPPKPDTVPGTPPVPPRRVVEDPLPSIEELSERPKAQLLLSEFRTQVLMQMKGAPGNIKDAMQDVTMQRTPGGLYMFSITDSALQYLSLQTQTAVKLNFTRVGDTWQTSPAALSDARTVLWKWEEDAGVPPAQRIKF